MKTIPHPLVDVSKIESDELVTFKIGKKIRKCFK
jgi:hypothetical protein